MEKEEWVKAFKKVDISLSTDEANYTLSTDELGEKPPIWIKDNDQPNCFECTESFTTFKRRHHCRACGNIFCNTCCKLSVPLKYDGFKEIQRVCNTCYKIVNKKYQDHIGQNNSPTSAPTSPNVLNQIIKKISPSKSREFTQDIPQNFAPEIKVDEIENKIEDVKLEPFDLNEQFRPAYHKPSRKALRRSSSNTSSNNEDSLSSCADEEIVKPKEEPVHSPKPPVPLRPKTKTMSPSKIFFKREPLFHEYGYLNKIQIKKDLRTDSSPNTSPVKSQSWERVCFVLFSDHTLGICPSHNDVHQPTSLIQLNLFILKNVDDTSFGLDKIMNDPIDNFNELELDFETKPIGRLSNRLKIFEFNFEFKFQNKEIK